MICEPTTAREELGSKLEMESGCRPGANWDSYTVLYPYKRVKERYIVTQIPGLQGRALDTGMEKNFFQIQ